VSLTRQGAPIAKGAARRPVRRDRADRKVIAVDEDQTSRPQRARALCTKWRAYDDMASIPDEVRVMTAPDEAKDKMVRAGTIDERGCRPGQKCDRGRTAMAGESKKTDYRRRSQTPLPSSKH